MSVKRKEEIHKSVVAWIFRESNMIRFAISLFGYYVITNVPNYTLSGAGFTIPTQPILALCFAVLFILAPDLRTMTKKKVEKL